MQPRCYTSRVTQNQFYCPSSLLSASTLTELDLGLLGWLLTANRPDQSQSHIATDGKSVSQSVSLGLELMTVTVFLLWGALSDERTGAAALTKVKVKITLRLTISQSVSLGIEPHLGPITRYLFLSDSYVLVSVGRPLWREDGSVFCMCCWPLGLATVFYCLRFETSLFVGSYDSQSLSLSLMLRPTDGCFIPRQSLTVEIYPRK
jgi:hypothetical protein